MGPDLMENMRAQAERFGAEIITDDVEHVELEGDVKLVRDGMGNEYAPRPSSSRWARPTASSVCRTRSALSGHGVSWCATCDGFFFRDQDIAVVGGGDSAMEEATFLTKFARSVTVVVRRDELRASRIMAERATANEKIHFAWNSAVDAIHGEDKVSAITLRDTVTGENARAAGHRPLRRHRPRPAQRARQGPGRPRRRGLRPHRGPHLERPTSRASSPAATSSTTPTARPSPPPRLRCAAPSTPSGSSPTDPLGVGPVRHPRVTTSSRRPHPHHPEGTPWSREQHHRRHLRGDVLKSDKPVLVDFWAEWCGPCRAVAPVLEEIARDHGDKVAVVKLNTDENPGITGQLASRASDDASLPGRRDRQDDHRCPPEARPAPRAGSSSSADASNRTKRPGPHGPGPLRRFRRVSARTRFARFRPGSRRAGASARGCG